MCFFTRRQRQVADEQLHATLVQTQMRLKGADWKSVVGVWDSGSPATIVKEGAVEKHLLRTYHGPPVRWGQATQLRIRGVADVELRWTSSTTQEVRGCLVVPDTELPPYTDIHFGNDTVRGLSKSEVTDTASGTAKLVFPHDAESVPLLFKWPDIQRVCQEKLGASTMTVMEELPVRMAVTAAQKYIVPARTERMIAGRLETAIQGTPEHDTNIVFFPDEHRVMMATTCAVIGGNNPEPWVPIKVCNNTDTDVVIRDEETIGVAHSS
jgi:hypothetical protein